MAVKKVVATSIRKPKRRPSPRPEVRTIELKWGDRILVRSKPKSRTTKKTRQRIVHLQSGTSALILASSEPMGSSISPVG